MYGDFVLFDEAGKLEKGERIYLGDAKGKNEAWLRDTLFENPEIIPVNDIDSTFGPLVPLCKELRRAWLLGNSSSRDEVRRCYWH